MKKIFLFTAVAFSVFYIYSSLFADDNRPVPDRSFTVEELSQFDGRKGNKAYVAIDGIVYDVTGNASWRNGRHKRGLRAGNDLSGMLRKSPHGNSVLKKMAIVGRLEKK